MKKKYCFTCIILLNGKVIIIFTENETTLLKLILVEKQHELESLLNIEDEENLKSLTQEKETIISIINKI